jgi:hypothetical protein
LSNYYWEILSLVIGFLIGGVNLFILSFLIKKIFFSKKQEDTQKASRTKLILTLFLSLKFLLILLAFYLVIVIFKFNVIYILIGFTLSLFLMFLLSKKRI